MKSRPSISNFFDVNFMQDKFNDQSVSTFNRLFEDLVGFCEKDGDLSEEILLAKEEYFQKTGKLKDKDREFDNRMNAFLLWYLFDRRPVDLPDSAVSLYCKWLEDNGRPDEASMVRVQKNHIHSLFVHEKTKNEEYVVRDLLTDRKYQVPENQTLLAFPKGAVFETRIFKFDDTYCFANYFIQHPLEVNASIRKQIKVIKADIHPRKPFFIKLHSYYVKWKNYRSIHIDSIYHFNASLPEAK